MTFLTPAEVRAEYRLGRDLVRRLIRDKEIPAAKIKGQKAE